MVHPFYNKDDPAYLNYGGIGTVMAHELSHAFDGHNIDINEQGLFDDRWNMTS